MTESSPDTDILIRRFPDEEIKYLWYDARNDARRPTRQVPEHQVRFTSGLTACVEALRDGRWIGRYWTADGRVNFQYEYLRGSAFSIRIADDPIDDGWEWVSGEASSQENDGPRHATIELRHPERQIGVRVHTRLDGTPVLVRWLDITNFGDKPLPLTGVAPWCGQLWYRSYFENFPPAGSDPPITLGYFTRDRHGYEGWLEWEPLAPGTTTVESRSGRGFDDPFFLLRNDVRGEYFVGHLAWSANWRMDFTREKDPSGKCDGIHFSLGPTADAALRVIAPGESVHTPAVHLGHVAGDLDAAVQAMHGHLRRSVLPNPNPERSFRIQYSVAGDQGFRAKRFDDLSGSHEAASLNDVDVAEAVGAEVYIQDHGWWDVYGDFVPAASRFPRGLGVVSDYAHEKGLLFGLYVEVEGGRGDWESSAVGTAHPEWFGPRNVLDLSISECAAWVESELHRMIEEYRLDLLRIDYNTGETHQGRETERHGIVENCFWRHYEAFYGMFERLEAKYPDLILQQAASGGARNDLGTASRFHEQYLTDGLEMPRVLQVYAGQTLALPPETFVTAFQQGCDRDVVRPDNIFGRSGPLETQLRNTFCLGTPWMFMGAGAPSVDELSPIRRSLYGRYAKIYKEFIRPILPTCQVFHHAPITADSGVMSSGWFAQEFASPFRTKGWALIVRIGDDGKTFRFIPRGLGQGERYRVTFDNTQQTTSIDGLRLTQEGLSVRLEANFSSDLLLFEAE